jgi:hypothetical protein
MTFYFRDAQGNGMNDNNKDANGKKKNDGAGYGSRGHQRIPGPQQEGDQGHLSAMTLRLEEDATSRLLALANDVLLSMDGG